MGKMQWYFINSGRCSPSFNMALDEKLMIWQKEKNFLPTLRFYQWNIPTLSIGYFQRVHRDIDLQKVKERNIGFVRRQTGGRGVLHDNELTYSVIVPENYPQMPLSTVEAYRIISKGILEGFRELGLEANFAIPETKEEKESLKHPHTAVCFDTPSWYEIVVEGRKIAGSAQVRKDGMLLQHGSIPLTIDVDLLYDLFLFSSEKLKERMKQGFVKKATAISEFVGDTMTVADLISPFSTGFEKGLDIELIPYEPTGEEEKEILHLAREKYESDQWTFRL